MRLSIIHFGLPQVLNFPFLAKRNSWKMKDFEELSLEADDCTTEDDYSFFEIESHGHSLLHLDVELKEKKEYVHSHLIHFSIYLNFQ